jgi:ribose transport system permease protein
VSTAEATTTEGLRKKWPALANIAGLLIALFVLLAVFSYYKGPTFASWANVQNIARNSAGVMVASVGMTFVIISGGIDLSVGSIATFACVAVAWMIQRGYNPGVAALAGVAAGVLAGAVNGTLITKLRVVPFIVTLGSLLIIRGAAKGLAGEQKIDAPFTWLKDLLGIVPAERSWMLLPYGVWGVFLLAIVGSIILQRSVFGRQVFAIGGNEQASHYSGLPVQRIKLFVYMLSGLFAGIAGVLLFSRLAVGDPTAAQNFELQVIAAVVIGGASLSGGQGSVLGAILGALIMQTISAGATQMFWPNWIQEIVTGAIIVMAVALDRLRQGRAPT